MENAVIMVLKRERESASRRVQEITAELATLKEEVKQFDDAIEKLSGEIRTSPRVAGFKSLHARSLREEILDMIGGAQAKGIGSIEITDRLNAAGRKTDPNSVLSLLSRMRKVGRVEKRDRRWFLAGSPAAKVEASPTKAEEAPTNPSSGGSTGAH